VVDLTSPHASEQCQTVEEILVELDVADRPRITALNKIDLLLPDGESWDEKSAIDYFSRQGPPVVDKAVLISAEKRWGLGSLLALTGHILSENQKTSS
jgi:GTP-binding protein HflX